MKRKNKIPGFQNFFVSLIAFLAFLTIEPWFIWNLSKDFTTILYISSTSALAILLFLKQSMKFSVVVLAYIACSFMMAIGGLEFNPHGLNTLMATTILFLLLPNDLKLLIFNRFQRILAIILALGMVTYTLHLFVDFSGFIIKPRIKSVQSAYMVYFFHINSVDFISQYIPRFMSVFDEPGVVGTLCAILISFRKLSLRQFDSFVFLMAGLMTFSLAFYIVLFINLMYNRLRGVRILIISFVVLSAIFIFYQESIDYYLIERFNIVNGKLAGDNRTTEYFDNAYNHFLKGSYVDLGFGIGARRMAEKNITENTYSYKILIYTFGVIGSLFILLFYTLSAWKIAPNKRGLFFLLVFILLAYQRINIFTFFNIVTFFGGLVYILYTSQEEIQEKKQGEFDLARTLLDAEKRQAIVNQYKK